MLFLRGFLALFLRLRLLPARDRHRLRRARWPWALLPWLLGALLRGFLVLFFRGFGALLAWLLRLATSPSRLLAAGVFLRGFLEPFLRGFELFLRASCSSSVASSCHQPRERLLAAGALLLGLAAGALLPGLLGALLAWLLAALLAWLLAATVDEAVKIKVTE